MREVIYLTNKVSESCVGLSPEVTGVLLILVGLAGLLIGSNN